MRYIVLSFDDGLKDFMVNALPLLDKYGFKATINVISGFVDGSVSSNYECISIDDVKKLYENGFEIANHTDSHLKHGSYDDLLSCNNKIKNWLGTDTTLGVVMPKYAEPSQSSMDYISKFNPPYFTYECKNDSFSNFIRRVFWKIIVNIKKTDYFYFSYLNQIKMYKKGTNVFRRVETGEGVEPEALYKSFKHIKHNHCITVVFHSITDDKSIVPYPKGAWSPKQFNRFLELLKADSNFMIVTQFQASSKG